MCGALKNLLKIVPLLACAYAGSAQALTINFTYDAAMDARALQGFQTAANRWQNIFTDDVQVNLNIAFTALAPTCWARRVRPRERFPTPASVKR